MNIKYIWKQHKILALLCCAYFLVFIWLNIKQGIVATPVLQYGMFSGKKTLSDTSSGYIFYVNNKKIPLSNLSFTERDILITSLEKFLQNNENNEVVYNSFSNIIQKANINLSSKKELYTNKITDSTFKNWYKQKIEKFTKIKVESVNIYKQKYNWQINNIQLVDTPKIIFSIAH